MSDTPRTDAQRILTAAKGRRQDGRMMTLGEAVDANFARILEREVHQLLYLAARHERHWSEADRKLVREIEARQQFTKSNSPKEGT